MQYIYIYIYVFVFFDGPSSVLVSAGIVMVLFNAAERWKPGVRSAPSSLPSCDNACYCGIINARRSHHWSCELSFITIKEKGHKLYTYEYCISLSSLLCVCIVMIKKKRFRFYTLELIGPQRFLFCILRLLLYGKKGCVNIKPSNWIIYNLVLYIYIYK